MYIFPPQGKVTIFFAVFVGVLGLNVAKVKKSFAGVK